ncbi:extracellular solute-binding protein [Paenibacillus hodogayensis]|uniref:Extracellular solute-binding protein n=1 Tax=Paenibacillus hodogayensis TaxID=279208 RepID=A0ABV5VQE7_9BACL
MLRHKNWLLLVAAACFVVILASALFSGPGIRTKPSSGTGGEVNEPAPVAGKAEKQLRMAVSMQSKPFALLQQLKEQYESTHPGVEVVLENMPEENAYAKLKKAAQLGEAPDVMLLDNSWVSEFAALGYLQPVDSLLTGSLQAEQMEQALAQVKWNGYVWGIPKNLDAYVVVYNAKRLSEWGEKPPNTSDELLALHKLTHKPEEGKYGIYLNVTDSRAFVSAARMLGGGKTVSKTAPFELADPGVQRALESFLFQPGDPAKEESRTLAKSFPRTSETFKPWDQLAQGKLTGYITTFSEWKQNDAPAFAMSALPLPKGEELWKGPWLSGKSFSISAKSEAGKEAFDLIRELVSTPASLKFWNVGGGLPAQTGIYVSSIKSDPAFKSVAAYIDQDDALPSVPQRAKQMAALQGQLESLWKGETAFKAFADRTVAEWNAIRPPASPASATTAK